MKEEVWKSKEKTTKAITKAVISITAIIGIVIVECKAIALGIDGVALGASVAAIAGLGGWSAKGLIQEKQG